MTVNVYSSFDAGAPSLTGEVGSLIAVLDACLVTGYGAKAAAGWTKPFVGTNIAAFRQGTGAQAYFQIVDDGSDGSFGPRMAMVSMYDTMTNATTGTNKTPSAYNINHYNHLPKSSTLDATAREWKVYASDRACYFLVKNGTSVADAYYVSYFGHYNAINPNYGLPAIICACSSGAAQNASMTAASLFNEPAWVSNSNTTHLLKDGPNFSVFGGLSFDNPNKSSAITSYRNGAMVFSPVTVRGTESITGAFAVLGVLPGLFTSYSPFAGNNTLIEFVNGAYAGRGFIVATGNFVSGSFSCVYIELTSDAW